MTKNQSYYLDNAATTRPFEKVVEQVEFCLVEDFGNPSSVHLPGVRAKRLVEESRGILAGIFGVPLEGVFFLSGGTESDNLAIKGLFEFPLSEEVELITTPLEHSAVLRTTDWLKARGVKIRMVRIDPSTARVDLDHLESLVGPKTRLVSVHHVNSETGIIQDLSAISRRVKKKNPSCLFHSDGVQAFGKLEVNLKLLGVDLYSISGHKFHAVKGSGALIMGKKIKLNAMIHGGAQERGLRSGTESVPLISAMGMAAKKIYGELETNFEKVERFEQELLNLLKRSLPELKILVMEEKLPHIISLAYPMIPGEVLLHHLAQKGVYVSTGSACHASDKKLSQTLTTLRFPTQRIKETIRISLDPYELPERAAALVDIFSEVVLELKRLV
ncbi:MAG: cysteine desulfurase [Deltaproteobacteria bacterium]|nr:cysteine desulfurase [Deltaproteobacteria bacterium]